MVNRRSPSYLVATAIAATLVSLGCSGEPKDNRACEGPFGGGVWPDVVCRNAYGDSSPFNLEIPQNPRVLANSAAIIQRVLGDIREMLIRHLSSLDTHELAHVLRGAADVEVDLDPVQAKARSTYR